MGSLVRDGDTLLVSKIDRLARSKSDLYPIISFAEKSVSFKVLDDTKLAHRQAGDGLLALIARRRLAHCIPHQVTAS